jgi:hypothetical protein
MKTIELDKNEEYCLRIALIELSLKKYDDSWGDLRDDIVEANKNNINSIINKLNGAE